MHLCSIVYNSIVAASTSCNNGESSLCELFSTAVCRAVSPDLAASRDIQPNTNYPLLSDVSYTVDATES